MRDVLPWLVRWARRVGAIDFCSALAALVSAVQNINFLTAHFFMRFISPHRPATWSGIRAVSPVSVSLLCTYLDTALPTSKLQLKHTQGKILIN
jgi:hypothetical protein